MNPIDLYTDPDVVGEAEYRAIYDLLASTLADCPPDERVDLCRRMLQEFRDAADSMLHILDKNLEAVDANADAE